jgi:hypothetical protein
MIPLLHLLGWIISGKRLITTDSGAVARNLQPPGLSVGSLRLAFTSNVGQAGGFSVTDSPLLCNCFPVVEVVGNGSKKRYYPFSALAALRFEQDFFGIYQSIHGGDPIDAFTGLNRYDQQALGRSASRVHTRLRLAAPHFEVVEETPELRPSVEQTIQGKVDTNHSDGIGRGLTLTAEERFVARETEITRTQERWDRSQESTREAQCRQVAQDVSRERRCAFHKRAASVDPWCDPERADPREELSQAQLATVNKQAMRLLGKLEGWSRAAISRRVAERVVDGAGVMGAVVGVYEELRTAPGQVIPIADVQDVNRKEVSIEGTVTQLWESGSSAIQQAGLIEDESGRTKLTSWVASGQPWIEEGVRVCIHGAAKNWYNGRVSIALTGWSTVQFPERGRWWE